MLIPSYIKIDQATSKYIEDFECQLDVLISKIQRHQVDTLGRSCSVVSPV